VRLFRQIAENRCPRGRLERSSFVEIDEESRVRSNDGHGGVDIGDRWRGKGCANEVCVANKKAIRKIRIA
jgi:hypothetical protein